MPQNNRTGEGDAKRQRKATVCINPFQFPGL